MKIKITETSKHKEFDPPTPMYFITKFFHEFPLFANILHTIESFWLNNAIKTVSIDRPIYITGLARAGSTITLEMLSQHPDIATHRYLHMVLPYIPHWSQQLANVLPSMISPVERLHKDRLLVTRDSPEAVEEIFWQKFFDNPHDEANSNILDSHTLHPQFESFYSNHIKKLLINQHASHYLAKNNYNVSRMEYLQKLFPDVKFIILIRNPFNHIASLIKQDFILKELEQKNSRLLDLITIIGHREFGPSRVCINLDNYEIIKKICCLWAQRNTYVKGWAVYWAEIYSFIHKKLQTNPNLARASLKVRYEDLCEFPKKTVNRIINHIEVDPKKFDKINEYYCAKLQQPTYYRSEYSEKEKEDIMQITKEVAEHYGYVLS